MQKQSNDDDQAQDLSKKKAADHDKDADKTEKDKKTEQKKDSDDSDYDSEDYDPEKDAIDKEERELLNAEKLNQEEAKKNEESKDREDILFDYLPELALIDHFNQDWFRCLSWRLRDIEHWSQVSFMAEVAEETVWGILEQVQTFDATRALKHAKKNIDSLNRLQRYAGFNQAVNLTCECTPDQLAAYELAQQQQNEDGENVSMNTVVQDGQDQTGAVINNVEQEPAIASLEKTNPRAAICGRHPLHVSREGDIKKLSLVAGHYIQSAIAQIARDDLGHDLL